MVSGVTMVATSLRACLPSFWPISANVLRSEDEIAELRERLSELEHQIGALQQRGLELKSEVERHESRIQFNQERLRELEAQNTRALAEISQAEERHHIAGQEHASVTSNLQSSEAALAQAAISGA